MNIHLTPEQERIVKKELETGRFLTPEDVIAEALRTLSDKNSAASNGDRAQAVRDMLSFAEKNSVRLEGISIKELIHEGHRL